VIVVQMHGEPGSGKSTLARALAPALAAVVLDKDVIGSALLGSGLARGATGPAAYECLWAVADSLLGQGHSLIVDSPAFWPSIEERGRGLARRFGAAYSMVECFCPDPGEIDRRLALRDGTGTQPTKRLDWLAAPGTRAPSCARLRLDSRRPLAELAGEAAAYVLAANGGGQ
jgi:predicted kinase